MKKKTLQFILHILLRTVTKTEYFGVDNIPTSGGVIFAFNHLSFMDTPLLLSNPIRPDITGLITTKYKGKTFFDWFVRSAEGLWINRDIADFAAIQNASKALKKGFALGISPEGTRSKVGKLQKAKQGTVMIAVKTGVPILPVGITGSETALDDLAHFRRPHMTVRFGKPFSIPSIAPGNRSIELKKWTHTLMLKIASLLPETYRGVYSDEIKEK